MRGCVVGFCSRFGFAFLFMFDLFICFEFYFDVLFCLFLVKEKNIVSVSRKAITWGHPLVIAPYNESVGLMSFDSTFTPFSSRVKNGPRE